MLREIFEHVQQDRRTSSDVGRWGALSRGKACEVARGSPVGSLLVLVTMREQGSSAKLLAFEKQLEDHEVAVLELER